MKNSKINSGIFTTCLDDKLYIKLLPNIRLAYFNEKLIMLDLLKNKYIILEDSFSSKLIQTLSAPVNFKQKNIFINFLYSQNIICNKLYNTREILPKRFTSAGMAEIEWQIDRDSLNLPVKKILVVKALFTLLKIDFYLKTNRFYALIKSLKDVKPCNNCNHTIDEIVCALNYACFYYFWRVKCLEWSLALTFMSLKANLNCKIAVGVQNYPFFSHAWVEHEGQVITDNCKLPENMSVILREPS